MLQASRSCCFFLLSCIFLFLSGCAGKEQLPRFVWPPPPDDPRLEYIGNYSSEDSFEKSSKEKLLADFLGTRGQATFMTPFGIVSNGQGIVYISDIHLKNVRVYDFNQKTVNFLTKNTTMGTPLGLALDRQGNLYIADAGLMKILVYGPDHQLRTTISAGKEAFKPSYLTVHEDLGRIYASDGGHHKIVVFSLSGEYLFSFGSAGNLPGSFHGPQGIAFGPDGNLYVADSFNARVQVLTPEGEFIRMFGERGDQAGQFENPRDLAFDSDGNLHVIDGRASNILTYTSEGILLLVTGSGKPGSSPFAFSTPRSIFIDGNDRIYIAESLNKRFTVWQYMSEKWLAQRPYTEADRQALLDYTARVAKEKEAKK